LKDAKLQHAELPVVELQVAELRVSKLQAVHIVLANGQQPGLRSSHLQLSI